MVAGRSIAGLRRAGARAGATWISGPSMPAVGRRGSSPPTAPTKRCWRGQPTAARSISCPIAVAGLRYGTCRFQEGAPLRTTPRGGLRAQESADGRFLYYSNDVPEVWRRPLHAPLAEELVTTFPSGTHWGGDWVVGARGLYYFDEQVPGTVGIDFYLSGRPARAPFGSCR